MTQDQLEDWQLALLVEARRLDDPALVEANDAEALRDGRDLLEDAEGMDNPTVVEAEVKQTHDEAEALLDAAQGIDEWEVVDANQREQELEACEAVRDALSGPLKEHHNLRDPVVESMGVEDVVEQFRDDDDDGKINLDALAQQPETGGAGSEETASGSADGGSSGSESNDLSADERNEVREKLERAEKMENRTPQYSDTLRAEAASIVGVDDADDIDMETL